MDPLTLTLLGYPLGILANITYDKLKVVSQKIEIVPLKNLLIQSFYKALEYHDQHYDDYSKKIVEKIRNAFKINEEKLLTVIARYSNDYSQFLSLLQTRNFQQKIAEAIGNEFAIELGNYPNLLVSIITDCLNYYSYAFFNQMNEKEGIQAILMECLKLETVIDILKDINTNAVTKNDFDELRKIILLNYYGHNLDARKNLDNYDQYLRNKFKYLELRGFSPKISGKEVQMELQDIFVPLAINAEKTFIPNILEEQMSILQRTVKTEEDDNEKKKVKDHTAAILEYRNLVILGDPGAGKSTLLKYLAVTVSRLRNSESLSAKMIPLFFRISDYADYYQKEKKTLYEFITGHYDKQYQHIYREAFECSNLLLLMDGLDEITDTPLRIRVTEQIMDLMARYPFNRYVVTSRIVGYQESKLGGDFQHYKLLPFELEEIKLFSDQWYKCIAEHTNGNLENAKEQANNLYLSITKSNSVIRLATNPLLMTIIAMIHYKGRKLPNKRVELYDVSTETFLEYWVQLRMQDESRIKDKTEIIEILAPIAFEIHQNKSNTLIEEQEFIELFITYFKSIHQNTTDKEAKNECKEFIDFLRKEAGFFYEKGVDDAGNSFYGFIHLTFEEYLAAIEFISRWNEGQIDLKEYIFNPRWVEVLRLAAAQLLISNKGRLGRIKVSEFIKEILTVDDPFPEAYRPLQLVCLILADDISITDELLNELLERIITALSQNEFPELIKSFAKLFNELLLSSYRTQFIDRFKKEAETANKTLLNNIINILISNSHDNTINESLKERYKRNIQLLKSIYQIKINNYTFQNTYEYKDGFKCYLNYLVNQNNDEEISKILGNYLQMVTKKYWYEWFTDINQDIINDLEQSIKELFFNQLLSFCLDHSLRQFLDSNNRRALDNLLIRFSNSQFIANLNKCLKMARINPNPIYTSSSSIYMRSFSVLLHRSNNSINMWFWPKTYDDVFYYSMEINEVPDYITKLNTFFIKSDIDIIQAKIFFISGPQIDSADLNIQRFLESNKCAGILYDYGGWEGFPLINIIAEPRKLSKVIVQCGEIYIDYLEKKDEIKGEINLDDFNNSQICPPAKMLAYGILNEPISKELLTESIAYFRNCPPLEKNGAFSIIYRLTNLFELA